MKLKIIIQCAKSKDKKTGTFVVNDRKRVKFVADPVLFGESQTEFPCRPDDLIPSESITWRDHLSEYNREYERKGENPYGLLQAGKLYSNPVYQLLFDHVGKENLYILSAGWGLIRSDFLIPDYDITFSKAKDTPLWTRRTERDNDFFRDFSQLTQADISPEETVYFFGVPAYLPLYYRLTESLEGQKVIYFNSSKIPPEEQGYEYIRYNTNART